MTKASPLPRREACRSREGEPSAKEGMVRLSEQQLGGGGGEREEAPGMTPGLSLDSRGGH